LVYRGLRHEITQYSPALAERRHIVVLTKRDLLPADAELPALDAPEAVKVVAMSSASGQGIDELKELLWTLVSAARSEESTDDDGFDPDEFGRASDPRDDPDPGSHPG
jgi:GTP-binding protein